MPPFLSNSRATVFSAGGCDPSPVFTDPETVSVIGVGVVITDVTDPFTGDLDGEKILVDYDIDAEDALFILVHLFGHTVQWNVSEKDRELGLLEVKSPTNELLSQLERYERDAARYSLQLFHEAGITDLDQ